MEQEEIRYASIMVRLASQLLYLEPDAERLRSYIDAELFDEVPFGADDKAVLDGAGLMAAWCAEHAGNSPEAFDEAVRSLKSEWFMLFIGAGAPKAPSWAGYYLTPKSQILSDFTLEVRRTYRAWGLQMESLNKEPDDSLGVLLGFLAFLMEIELSDDNRAETARNCQLKVLTEWVLPWIGTWHWTVSNNAKSDFFQGLGNLIFGLLRSYATRFDIKYIDAGPDSRFVRVVS